MLEEQLRQFRGWGGFWVVPAIDAEHAIFRTCHQSVFNQTAGFAIKYLGQDQPLFFAANRKSGHCSGFRYALPPIARQNGYAAIGVRYPKYRPFFAANSAKIYNDNHLYSEFAAPIVTCLTLKSIKPQPFNLCFLVDHRYGFLDLINRDLVFLFAREQPFLPKGF